MVGSVLEKASVDDSIDHLDFESELQAPIPDSIAHLDFRPELPTVHSRAISYDRARSPKSEIYGRSLSTIHRLGAYMIGKTLEEVIHSPEAEQARAEFFTSVEEGFGTDIELGGGLEVRDFDNRAVVDGKIMAKDLKTPISSMTAAGLECAKETAKRDHRFLPQLTRSYWDHENALLNDKMARGETDYNTRIVVSPFPEEAAAKSGNEYWKKIGYVPHLKRGFVQIHFVDDEGVFAGSLSFDGSNKARLKRLFSQYDINIPDSETTDNWLQYAITRTMTRKEAKKLALKIADEANDPKYKKNGNAKVTNTVHVTQEHRSIMNKVFNESYVHACESHARKCQTPELQKLNTQLMDKMKYINGSHTRALRKMNSNKSNFTAYDTVKLHEVLVYSTIEMIRSFHLQKTQSAQNYNSTYQKGEAKVTYIRASMDAELFQRALGGFGLAGAIGNRTYSACGLSISLGDETSRRDNDDLQSSSDGHDRERERLSWHGGKIKKDKCVNCKKVTEVGVANWCKKCIKC